MPDILANLTKTKLIIRQFPRSVTGSINIVPPTPPPPRLTASTGLFTLTGLAAGLVYTAAATMTASAGLFALSGNAAGLSYSPAGINDLLQESGDFVLLQTGNKMLLET